ncbi:hypothetical protein [Serratia grimesii]|uniref:hypothetical protein n=1 Tax=Serratia grimesii TaxID=82995 RepID=UPI00077C9B1D|nr:hypothetical protein [Serratia grimesii]CAI0727058.1 Uncharacterised protein [Serratia grimesii]CAI2444631.1 Uncharacterised protein [Serratia grimesii]SUI32681.1 Uncharacterised protein [Serratia grimesii]
MNNPIDTIIEDVQAVKDGGTEFIDTEKLLGYLKDLKDNETQSHEENLERLKATNQFHIERLKLIANANLESFRSVIATGANASKSCMLVNGGAAVALLAFVGNIWNKNPNAGAVAELAYGILFFCSGVGLAALCTGITYIAQYCYASADSDSDSKWDIAGNIFNILAVLAGLASLILFGYGCYSAFEAITLQNINS